MPGRVTDGTRGPIKCETEQTLKTKIVTGNKNNTLWSKDQSIKVKWSQICTLQRIKLTELKVDNSK